MTSLLIVHMFFISSVKIKSSPNSTFKSEFNGKVKISKDLQFWRVSVWGFKKQPAVYVIMVGSSEINTFFTLIWFEGVLRLIAICTWFGVAVRLMTIYICLSEIKAWE